MLKKLLWLLRMWEWTVFEFSGNILVLKYKASVKDIIKLALNQQDHNHYSLFWTSVIVRSCLEVLRIKTEKVDRNVGNTNEKSFCVLSIYNLQSSISKLLELRYLTWYLQLFKENPYWKILKDEKESFLGRAYFKPGK